MIKMRRIRTISARGLLYKSGILKRYECENCKKLKKETKENDKKL